MGMNFKKAIIIIVAIFVVAISVMCCTHTKTNDEPTSEAAEEISTDLEEYVVETTEYVGDNKFEYVEPTKGNLIEAESISGESSDALISLGVFKLTAYCPCSICCGKWAGGATASGAMPKARHTIAVDTSVIPFGTKIIIEGITYVAEDTGGAIKGNKIDVFFDSHQEALNFGVQYKEVFKVTS